MDIGSWITAISTFILALITSFYVVYTKKILDAQTDPYVIVSTFHDPNRPTIIQIAIRNIGSGLATDISFTFSKPLPVRAWGLSVDKAKEAEYVNAGPLIDGIPGLAPGEARYIDWGQYGGLMKAIGEDPVYITTTFKKNKKTMTTVSAIDVKSYKDTNASTGLGAQIAGDISDIAKKLGYLTTSFKNYMLCYLKLKMKI